MRRVDILNAIADERLFQQEKWGAPHDWGTGDASSHEVEPMTKVGVLTEELGEVARAVLERDDSQLRAELIQLAAVAIAWLEGL
jgi:NTP pyrophosphatase (non-canonical NTP hydrolase)